MEKFDYSKFDRGLFVVNVLAVVHDPDKNLILIGKREDDEHMPKLTWCFPGGRPAYEDDLEHYLTREVKKKTGLEVKPQKVFFAKTYPENRHFLSIYYYCTVVGGLMKTGEKHVENQWVKPTEARDYFTTSLHPSVYEFLERL